MTRSDFVKLNTFFYILFRNTFLHCTDPPRNVHLEQIFLVTPILDVLYKLEHFIFCHLAVLLFFVHVIVNKVTYIERNRRVCVLNRTKVA